jgi:hypothetical protein
MALAATLLRSVYDAADPGPGARTATTTTPAAAIENPALLVARVITSRLDEDLRRCADLAGIGPDTDAPLPLRALAVVAMARLFAAGLAGPVDVHNMGIRAPLLAGLSAVDEACR